MTGNPAPLVAAQDAAGTVAGHLAFLAEAQPASAPDAEIGNGWHGGFARDFATADGERVMVTALTRQQFADLAKTTRLARTFAFLERALYADFSACGDLYTHRATIGALLAPWFFPAHPGRSGRGVRGNLGAVGAHPQPRRPARVPALSQK